MGNSVTCSSSVLLLFYMYNNYETVLSGFLQTDYTVSRMMLQGGGGGGGGITHQFRLLPLVSVDKPLHIPHALRSWLSAILTWSCRHSDGSSEPVFFPVNWHKAEACEGEK